jgi:hypothetical protein
MKLLEMTQTLTDALQVPIRRSSTSSRASRSGRRTLAHAAVTMVLEGRTTGGRSDDDRRVGIAPGVPKMQTYLYEGRNRLGERMKGRIESANPQAVRKWLMESDIAPTKIRELPKPAQQPEWFTNLTGENKVSLLELQLLTRQMANMVRAGMPLMLAIEGIQRSTASKALAKALLACVPTSTAART